MPMHKPSFAIGLVTGIALVAIPLCATLVYFYNKGIQLQAAEGAKAIADCMNQQKRIASLMSTKVDPILRDFRSGSFTKAQLTQALLESLQIEASSASNCAIRSVNSTSNKNGVPLEQSSAYASSNALMTMGGTLNGISSTKCDRACEEILIARVEEQRKAIGAILSRDSAN